MNMLAILNYRVTSAANIPYLPTNVSERIRVRRVTNITLK